MIKIVIADDHPVLIDGLKSALCNEPNITIIGEANNGVQLLKILKKKKPDIVLLDILMPKMTGLEAAKIIQKDYEKVKLLFLSQFDDKWLIKKCIEVGAKGYLIKNISKEVLINSINIVSRGELNFFYQHGNQ